MRFVCWLWRGRGFWKPTATYDQGHVERLASMLRRHGGHALTCIHDGCVADSPVGFDTIRMPTEAADLPDYLPKLWAWSFALHELIGERFASIDLDVVLIGDVAPLLAGPEPIRLWDSAKLEPYNTSLFAVEPGYGCEVWNGYTPERLARARQKAAYWTGDQSWVAHVLGPKLPTFGERDGVIRYRPGAHRLALPEGSKAAFFCGPFCPRTEAEHSRWVRDAWA